MSATAASICYYGRVSQADQARSARKPGIGDHNHGERAAAPARRAAYSTARRVFEDGAYAPQALNAAAASLDDRDRALARRLAYGTIQRRLTLDTVIAKLARRPVERIEPPLLAALRLGCYELLYSGGAPPYATVDDAVRLARAARPRTGPVSWRCARTRHEPTPRHCRPSSASRPPGIR